MLSSLPLSRRDVLKAGVGTGISLALSAPGMAATPNFKLEKPDVRIGASVGGAGFLPVYVAVDHTWRPAGITGDLYSFRADTELAQALAGDSVDVACISLDGLVSLIAAGQLCMAVYGGFNTAAFAWVSAPSIKSWRDVKNTSIAITSFGSMTDEIARDMLAKHGLAPLTEVQIVQGGPPLSQLQILQSGRVQAALLAPPWTLIAKSQGFNVLATEKDEVASEWPAEVWAAKTKFIENYPGTLTTILRAHVAAVRLARTNPSIGADSLVNALKIKPDLAKATYDALMPTFDDRGRLPDPKNMARFWAVQQVAGKVTAPWPNSKFLDDRFIKTFSSWAP
jgi:ABC-type nitrate/sulfonate/bicarbonate transport system substrate-binding protein